MSPVRLCQPPSSTLLPQEAHSSPSGWAVHCRPLHPGFAHSPHTPGCSHWQYSCFISSQHSWGPAWNEPAPTPSHPCWNLLAILLSWDDLGAGPPGPHFLHTLLPQLFINLFAANKAVVRHRAVIQQHFLLKSQSHSIINTIKEPNSHIPFMTKYICFSLKAVFNVLLEII